jgi:sugar phosphate isomerase/epimerase
VYVTPNLSINQICTPEWTFEQDVAFLVAEGLGAISLSLPKIELVGLGRAAALLREAGLEVALVGASGYFALAEEERLREQIGQAIRHLEWAAQLQSPILQVVVGAAVALSWEEQRDLFLRVLDRLLPEAERHGVRLAIENHSRLRPEVGFVHELHEALDLVEEVGSPHLGVVAEMNNAWTERGLYDNLRRRHHWIAIVQVNDHRLGTACVRERVPIGDGVIPLRRIVRTLKDAGYAGFFDLELLGPAQEELGYAEAIRRSVAAFRELWTA